MLGANLFFKQPEVVNKPAVVKPEFTSTNQRGIYNRVQPLPKPFRPINNDAVRPVDGHFRFGFQTRLDHEIKPLPTAPAVVGGNVDWTKSKVTPATQYLHSVLSGGRPMNPAPALGSTLRLGEPTVHSIHTTY
jgi:hypothetical protein